MKCEQCIFSQEQEEDCLQTLFWDTLRWLQLSGTNTPAKSSESEPPKDGSPISASGKEMYGSLTHPNTPAGWIASMRVSHARTLALLADKQVLAKGQDRVFTEKSCELLAQLDPATSSWKMSPQLSRRVLTKLSKTWPAWGMTQGGCAYGHPMSGHLIKETDGFYSLPTSTAAMEAPNKKANTKGPKNLMEVAQGKWNHLWPTPNQGDSKQTGNVENWIRRQSEKAAVGINLQQPLAVAVNMWPTPTTSTMPCEGKQRLMRTKWLAGEVTLEEASAIAGRDVRKAQGMVPAMWPTPTAHNAKEGAYPAEYTLNTPTLASRVGGQLNPLWVEWLMGWPIGWTDSKQSATAKSRSKRRSPLPSWLTGKK